MTPFNAPAALVGASVKLSIAVQSTQGEVLAVPVNALSIGADGRERVQVDRGAAGPSSSTCAPGCARRASSRSRRARPAS